MLSVECTTRQWSLLLICMSREDTIKTIVIKYYSCSIGYTGRKKEIMNLFGIENRSTIESAPFMKTNEHDAFSLLP